MDWEKYCLKNLEADKRKPREIDPLFARLLRDIASGRKSKEAAWREWIEECERSGNRNRQSHREQIVKEFSLPFSGPMVRAILGGRKTVTRRIVNPPKRWNADMDKAFPDLLMGVTPGVQVPCDYIGERTVERLRNPWGYPNPARIRISEEVTVRHLAARRYQVTYAADDSVVTRFATPELYARIKAYKRPRLRGVTLPAAYARDERLEVVGVRAERLQDITDTDAWAEGCPDCVPDGFPSSLAWFHSAWESINGPGSWNENPLVWVVEFKLVDPTKADQ